MAIANSELASILESYAHETIFSIQPQSGGHIHDSYHVRMGLDGSQQYILQRMNTQVFSQPDRLMENLRKISEHIANKSISQNRTALQLQLTLKGESFYKHSDGSSWRMFPYIADTYSIGVPQNLEQVFEAARVTGEFLVWLSDLPIKSFFTPLEDFHHTPKRFNILEKAIQTDSCQRTELVQDEIRFIRERKGNLGIIQNALETSTIPWRINHNDTKLENILFSRQDHHAVCMIDLDTVMPGSLLFDFGDAIRSMSNSASEDEANLNLVNFRMDVFNSYAQGFISATREMLTDQEVVLLPMAPWVITLENGIRFLTDYLQGDTYFKINHPQQNLHRCRTQLKLVQQMETQQKEMIATVQKQINLQSE